jgi:hypothetical protein
MTLSATVGTPTYPGADTDYQPGVCNIGPAEIAKRRRAGHIGLIATVLAFAVMVMIDAPPLARFLVALPAAVAASGYLQARFRFCAGFGQLGVFNFGQLGATERVDDPVARERDRARARQIGLAAFLVGAAVGVMAYALPI